MNHVSQFVRHVKSKIEIQNVPCTLYSVQKGKVRHVKSKN